MIMINHAFNRLWGLFAPGIAWAGLTILYSESDHCPLLDVPSFVDVPGRYVTTTKSQFVKGLKSFFDILELVT